MKISWTPTARQTYFTVLEYLSIAWTKKEVENFISRTEHTIFQISKDPYMFKASQKKQNIRKGLITEHNSLYYKVDPKKKEIVLLTFRDNRQDPSKIKQLLYSQ
jgi:plasmid stabilization system protein ParE